MLGRYIGKMRGAGQSPPRVGFSEILWSFVGSLICIGSIAYLDGSFFEGTDLVLILGSFGASAVLVFGAIRSPLAQPPNLIGGHVISAFIGVSAYRLFYTHPCLAAGLAVATAVSAMHATKTLHPPGGATALIAVIGGEKIHSLGYLYVFMPVAAGTVIMLAIAVLFNNIPRDRRYPEFWL